MDGAWARLVNHDGSDEHLALCNEALLEVQMETERRLLKGGVLVPATGRFVVNDGVVYRIKDMWIEQRASNRQRLGVVIWKGMM